MKLTFEGETLVDIQLQLELFLDQLIGYQNSLGTQDPGPEEATEQVEEKATEQVEEEDDAPGKLPKRKPGRPRKSDVGDTTSEPAKTETKAPKLADQRKEALSLLMTLYKGAHKAAVIKLLDVYGVKKFLDIPEDDAPKLLASAKAIEARFV